MLGPFDDEANELDELKRQLQAAEAAYACVCEAITPGQQPYGAEAMALMIKMLHNDRRELGVLRDLLRKRCLRAIDRGDKTFTLSTAEVLCWLKEEETR